MKEKKKNQKGGRRAGGCFVFEKERESAAAGESQKFKPEGAAWYERV